MSWLLEQSGVTEAVVRIFVLSFTNDFGGDATDDGEVGDVVGDDSAGGNHGAFTNSDARKNDGPRTDEDVVPDFDWRVDGMKVVGVDVMFRVVNEDLGSDVDVVTDGDGGTAIEEAAIADDGAVADFDVVGLVEATAGVESAPLPYAHAGKAEPKSSFPMAG